MNSASSLIFDNRIVELFLMLCTTMAPSAAASGGSSAGGASAAASGGSSAGGALAASASGVSWRLDNDGRLSEERLCNDDEETPRFVGVM